LLSPTKRPGEGPFAKSCVDIGEISTTKRGDREILYYKREEIGRDISELLEEMVLKWIKSMNFGKMMRWGDSSFEFIRPVRWLQVRLGSTPLDIELFGVKSSTTSASREW